LKFSRARKRYERQGPLVEDKALVQAENECLADDDRGMEEDRKQPQTNADYADYTAPPRPQTRQS
jgi:hypothetical protein